MIGRGCSTKDKVFYRECETHSYGDTTEKMCFCSFKLCNSAASASPFNAHSTTKVQFISNKVLQGDKCGSLHTLDSGRPV